MKKKFFLGLLVCLSLLSTKSFALNPETVSDVGRWGIPLYALGMAQAETTNQGMKELFLSAIGAQIAAEALKKLTQEKRPDWEPGNVKNSFPSGHAVGAFSGAMFIHRRYGLQYAIVPYIFATYTSYQRVDSKAHHTHDVLAGAALSALFTLAFVSKYDKSNTQIAFAIDKDEQKIEYKVKF